MRSRPDAEPERAADVEFHKILIANRGEIARRVVRTVREMGLRSVAVFSDADENALHGLEADEAVRLGPAPSAESYLDQDAVIAAAHATGAGAIHPGYGFLSENAEFARRCREEGLVFIGPDAEAIARMGRKDEAKALAASVGVPVLGGFSLAGLDADARRTEAEALGFPLLVKAAAGGGGKGMRRVDRAEDLDDAVAAAGREARGAFGDDALLLERLLEAPRHVEVQIFGDGHGAVVHLFERDCSVQRRHQKVFEEAPSPAVDDALRRRMGDAAVRLARAVDYRGAGTVEFLLDSEGEFYFLEMNTRLQVEHPVTEAITGLDLVRLQIEVARGAPLPFTQDELVIDGHALEARLYAEDPAADFLPATGRVVLWREPELPGLRIDAGVRAGDRVTVHYDPLLAKVIAHGATRDEALGRLRRGLEQLAVGGLTTNRDFLLAVLDHDDFRAGRSTTRFLDEHPELRGAAADLDVDVDAVPHAIAATLHGVLARRRRPSPLPAGLPAGWRNNRWRPQEQTLRRPGAPAPHGELTVRYVERPGDRFEVTVGDDRFEVRLATTDAPGEDLALEIDGVRRPFRVRRVPAGGLQDGDTDRRLVVHGDDRAVDFERVPRFPEPPADAVAGGCAAPMTGLVIDVPVAAGDIVEAGATLVVLEAMKMEHRLTASVDGVVESVAVKAGDMVDPDQVLAVVTPRDGEGDP